MTYRKISSKRIFAFLLFFCFIIFTISPNDIQALETLQSAWPTNAFSVENRIPNIGDWIDASKIDETLENSGSFHYFRLYVKNDFSYLWIGIVVKNISFTSAQLSICIDANNDGQWPEDLKRIHTLNGKSDRYWTFNNPTNIIDPSGVNFWGRWKEITSSLPGGDVDSYFFVFQIPLTSNDKLYDLQVSEPEGTTIGVGFAYSEGNQDADYWPMQDNLYDAANYLKLTLAGPGAVAPPDYVEEPPGGETQTTTATQTQTGTTSPQTTVIESTIEAEGAPGFSFLMGLGSVLLFSTLIKSKRKK